MLKMFPGNSFR